MFIEYLFTSKINLKKYKYRGNSQKQTRFLKKKKIL